MHEIRAQDADDRTEEEEHQDTSGNYVLIEDRQEARQLQILQRVLRIADLLGQLGYEEDTNHLLMARSETAAIGQLGYRFNGEIRGNCPVRAEQHTQHDDHIRVLQLREAEDNQP